MASLNGLPEDKIVAALSENHQNNSETVEEVVQKSKDMSDKINNPEEDQLSTLDIKKQKEILVGGNTQYAEEDEKHPSQQEQQNIQQILANRNNARSNKDSGISGSSNESVSQIPSPVEEEYEMKENGEMQPSTDAKKSSK